MNKQASTIIDVDPLDPTHDDMPSGTRPVTQPTPYVGPTHDKAQVIDRKPEDRSGSGGNRIVGAVQALAGGAVILVGIPMLILPGPGLLAVGGGAILMVSGMKKIWGKKR